MLKRKKSSLTGGLTSSCRTKAEALARAFNNKLWPCTWRSPPRQEEDEEFYEASPVEDEDWCGRGPDRSAATDEGRAKLYELLHQHALDDATDVYYDVSEHAGVPEIDAGNVSGRPDKVILHEPGEISNGVNMYGEWSKFRDGHETCGGCSKYESCDSSETFDDGTTANVNTVNGELILEDGSDESVPVAGNPLSKESPTCECVSPPTECSKYESCDSSETVNDGAMVNVSTVNGGMILEDGSVSFRDESVSITDNQLHEGYSTTRECEFSLNECSKCENCDSSKTLNGSAENVSTVKGDLALASRCVTLPDECLPTAIKQLSRESHEDGSTGIQSAVLEDNGGNSISRNAYSVSPSFHSKYESSCDIEVTNKSSSQSSKFADSCDTPNSINTNKYTEKECLNCEVPNQFKIDNQSSSESANYSDCCDNSCGINVCKQSIAKCSEFGDSCHPLTDNEAPEIVNDSNEPSISACALECLEDKELDNQVISGDSVATTDMCCSIEYINNPDSPSKENAGNSINIINETESIAVSSLMQLNSPNCDDISINLDSDYYAKSESTDTESTSLEHSFESLPHRNGEDPLLCLSAGNYVTDESLCSTNTPGELENLPELETITYDADFSTKLKSGDKSQNLMNASNYLSDFEHENHLDSPTIKDNPKNAINSLDFVDVDLSPADKEEVLTVIFDSNSIEVHQSSHHSLKAASSSNYQYFSKQNPVENHLKRSNHNNGEETISTPLSCQQLAAGISSDKISKLRNECSAIIQTDYTPNLYSSDSNGEQVVTVEAKDAITPIPQTDLDTKGNKLDNIHHSKCKTDQELASLEPERTVSIQVTNGSPTFENHVSLARRQYCEDNDDGQLKALTDDGCRLKVFDENRPMISRSTSLKTGKTPPGTPSRKKIVRFADVLGLDLEDVRHIISGDLPNIPSSAYSDLELGSDSFPATVQQSVVVDLGCRQQATWERLPGLSGPNALYPLFAIPGQQSDFMERVRSNGVCLENVVIEDCNVQCTCRVMNWGYNKKVVARYTTNGWTSSSDINASYVSDSTRDGADSFAFNIFLSRERNDLQLAIRYEVNGNEYWDSNGGKNYCFSYHNNNNAQTSEPISPSWMGHFW